MTSPTRLVCSPWITTADVPPGAPTLQADVWDQIFWAVSERLYVLTGRRWAGDGCQSTVTLTWPVAGCTSPVMPRGEPISALLPGAPVTAIVSATVDGEPFTDYRANLPAGLIALTGVVPAELVVTYRHGIGPPEGGRLAAALLAVEVAKRHTGDDTCRLPSRVQTVTREGVTMQIVDEAEDARQGWTGIPEVDGWVAAMNPQRAARPASVWSPDAPRVR